MEAKQRLGLAKSLLNELKRSHLSVQSDSHELVLDLAFILYSPSAKLDEMDVVEVFKSLKGYPQVAFYTDAVCVSLSELDRKATEVKVKYLARRNGLSFDTYLQLNEALFRASEVVSKVYSIDV